MRPIGVMVVAILFAFSNSTATGREWSDATGKFSVEAELVAVRSGKVILEKTDGSFISVPIDRLSDADQAFIASHGKPTPVVPSPDRINVWDVGTQQRIYVQGIPHGGYIKCLCTAPDSKHAAAAGRREVSVFRLPEPR